MVIRSKVVGVVEVVKEVEVIKEVVKEVPVAVPAQAAQPQPAASTISLEDSLALFSQQQSEILRTHQQYLANQADYIKVFTQLQQQISTLSPDTADSVTNSMTAFHEHQAETLRVHETYLQRQSEQTQALLGVMRGGNSVSTPVGTRPASSASITPALAPVISDTIDSVPTTTPEPTTSNVGTGSSLDPEPVGAQHAVPLPPAPVSTPGISVEALSAALLEIVSEKTGYPTEMLELEMDIEADLGIDSIKRVEILGAMRDEFPALPQLKAEELAELRTLQQIVDYMRDHSGEVNGASPQPVGGEACLAPNPSHLLRHQHWGISVEALSTALLDIVSEKTGYPTEMLELEMDIEADLGIDSIKRVEILGAMRDEFPALPQLKAEELAELRTLQQIVDYMRDHSGEVNGASSPEPVGTRPASSEPTPTSVETDTIDGGPYNHLVNPRHLGGGVIGRHYWRL